VARGDPALQGRERHALAGPVVEGPQADVVARVEIAVVNREVDEIQECQEGIRRARPVVSRDEAASLLEECPGPIGLGILGGLDEVEGGRGHEQVTGRPVGDGVADHRVRLGPERQPVLRLQGAGLALGVVERPLVEADHRLPRGLDEPFAQLDRLGEDDLLLGGQEGDAADLPEVHPDRVVHTEHVGRERLGLLGRRLGELPSRRCLELLILERGGSIGGECARLGPFLVDHLDPDDERASVRRGQVETGVGGRIRGRDREGAGIRGTTADCPGARELDYGERPRSEA
jgi:hypothetical protein